MARNKTVINIHARNYIAAVFEKRLREEGFSCSDDKLLCWYRVQGNQILNSIIFYSPWSNLPLMLNIGYSIQPLFLEPVFTNSVHFTKRPWDPERFLHHVIIEDVPINSMGYSVYSPEILVDAPGHPGKGIYTLDGIILPKMDRIHSVDDAYTFHKRHRLDYYGKNCRDPKSSPIGPPSKGFIDMALYMGDQEVYPFCEEKVKNSVLWYPELIRKEPNNKELAKEADEWNALLTAFTEEGRKAYLEQLTLRRQTYIQFLRKRLGIVVPE